MFTLIKMGMPRNKDKDKLCLQLRKFNKVNQNFNPIPVMAKFGHQIKQILRETLIELLLDKVNKLRDINVDKIFIDDIFDDIPESDEEIIKHQLNTHHK